MDKYVAIIQTQFSPKAQKVFLALPNRVTYEQLKEALLRAHEVIPEAHSQKFRNHLKSEKETFSDHAYNLNVLFTKWVTGLNCFSNLDRLKQVLLLERLFETLPESIKLLLIDKDPTTLEEAARLVDTYAVNHKVNARSCCVKPAFAVETPEKPNYNKNGKGQTQLTCYRCHQLGHGIKACSGMQVSQI